MVTGLTIGKLADEMRAVAVRKLALIQQKKGGPGRGAASAENTGE
ncbi:hypothetical protein [Rudaea sp.]